MTTRRQAKTPADLPLLPTRPLGLSRDMSTSFSAATGPASWSPGLSSWPHGPSSWPKGESQRCYWPPATGQPPPQVSWPCGPPPSGLSGRSCDTGDDRRLEGGRYLTGRADLSGDLLVLQEHRLDGFPLACTQAGRGRSANSKWRNNVN